MDAIANLTAATRRLSRAEEEWFAAIHAAAAGWKVETIAAAAGIEVAEVEKILGRATVNAIDRVA